MAVLTTERLSESVGALVEGVDRDRLLSDDALPAWCLETLEANGALVFRGLHLDACGLARQKWPESVHVVDDFPRTASGKVQKFRLRQQLRDGNLPGP